MNAFVNPVLLVMSNAIESLQALKTLGAPVELNVKSINDWSIEDDYVVVHADIGEELECIFSAQIEYDEFENFHTYGSWTATIDDVLINVRELPDIVEDEFIQAIAYHVERLKREYLEDMVG